MKDNYKTAYTFLELHQEQRRILAQAMQVHQDYRELLRLRAPLKGGMHWKKIKGREYLYKYHDRHGHGHSLGPRSPDTERLWEQFGQERRELTARLHRQRQLLTETARFCRAARLHRVPDLVVRLLRRLEADNLGAPLLVIGPQALPAYEFAAEVFLEAPPSSPLRSGSRQGLTLLATATLPPEPVLALLRRVDRSFRALPVPGVGLAAVNQQGFMVRCLPPPTVPAAHPMTGKDLPAGAVPASFGDLAALGRAPKFSQVVIGRRGDPVTMVVPDPRALALHQLWLSQQQGRDPARQLADRLQALALVELILRYLPQYYFFSAQLQWFPAEVVRHAEKSLEDSETADDFTVEY